MRLLLKKLRFRQVKTRRAGPRLLAQWSVRLVVITLPEAKAYIALIASKSAEVPHLRWIGWLCW